MLFPNISDYKSAIAVPESFVTLGNLRPEQGLFDDVYFSSGNFGVVFKMRDTQTDKLHAVKCFTREQERRTESLDNISKYWSTFQSPYIVPYTFLKYEIWVNDTEYPVLLMDWVDGVTLGEKVKALCAAQDTVGLHRLTVAFTEMALWLLEQDWAHGDLKHDNILVRPDDSLALVDYDGCFVPSMSGQNAREIGSPCYRHPKRTAQHFDRHIDDFSILLIFLSLRALSQNPDLFETHQNGENLLFSVIDLAEPQGSVLLGQLRRSADIYVQESVSLLDFSVTMESIAVLGLKDGILRLFFEEFKEDLLPNKVILRCKNKDSKEVFFEVDSDIWSINLNNKELVIIPSEICQLTKLTELNLYENQLTSLPSEICQLTNLTTLNLGRNQVSCLPSEISQLTNLMKLDISFNKLTSLPSEISQLTNLTTLVLCDNQLASFPPEFGQLTNLKVLNLRYIPLKRLPSEICQLTNLTTLDLRDNKLTDLIPDIGKLTNLIDLDLQHNKLTNFPPEFGQLTNLTILNLRYNPLIRLPYEIGQLPNLTTLDIRNTQLTNLSSQIGKLANLIWLGLCDNQLTNLPPEIGQLKNLQTIDFRYNKLTNLPPEIGQLTNLVLLDLKYNRLKNLPNEIGLLINLKRLYLQDNWLQSLPLEIGQLMNLEWLYLDSNRLKNLPNEIGQLSKLRFLSLKGNQLLQDQNDRIQNLLPKCKIYF